MCGILGLLASNKLPLGGRELHSALQSIRYPRGGGASVDRHCTAGGSGALALGGPKTVARRDQPDVSTADLSRFRCTALRALDATVKRS